MEALFLLIHPDKLMLPKSDKKTYYGVLFSIEELRKCLEKNDEVRIMGALGKDKKVYSCTPRIAEVIETDEGTFVKTKNNTIYYLNI